MYSSARRSVTGTPLVVASCKGVRLPAEHSSRCCWFCLSGFLSVPCRFPFDPFEVKYKDRVEDWNQKQGDKGSDGKSADLGIAERFPERAAFKCEREQGKDCWAYGNHH